MSPSFVVVVLVAAGGLRSAWCGSAWYWPACRGRASPDRRLRGADPVAPHSVRAGAARRDDQAVLSPDAGVSVSEAAGASAGASAAAASPSVPGAAGLSLPSGAAVAAVAAASAVAVSESAVSALAVSVVA